jgi:hypothetical protein
MKHVEFSQRLLFYSAETLEKLARSRRSSPATASVSTINGGSTLSRPIGPVNFGIVDYH